MEENISKGLFGLKRTDVENYIADIVAEPGNPSNKILKIK